MPRVRIMTSISTTEASYKRGQEVDLDEATAQSWVEAGMAVPTGSREPNPDEKQQASTGGDEQKEASADEATDTSTPAQPAKGVSADEDEQTVPETTARRTGRPAARKPKGR